MAERRRLVGNLGAIVRSVAQEIRVGYKLESMCFNVVPRIDFVNAMQGTGICGAGARFCGVVDD